MSNGGVIEIPLGNRRGVKRRGVVRIDAADAHLVEGYGWSLMANGYAMGRLRGVRGAKPVYMHRLLMGLGRGDRRQVDHVNQDKLDNRRANLRICDDALNRQNGRSLGGSSRFRGVSFVRRRNKWEAYANLDGRRHHLGYFDSEIAAAEAASEFRAAHMPFSEDNHGKVAA